MRLLLEAGADAEITNEGGIGPLRMAMEKGHDEIAVR